MKYKITYQTDNKLQTKIIESDSKEQLYTSKEFPLNVIKIKELNKRKNNQLFFANKRKEIYDLFKQLNIMLSSSLTINQSIELLLKTQEDRISRDILLIIENSIKHALPVEQTLFAYKNYLGETTILFLKLGIENGNLKESINSLVEILEEDMNSYEKVKEVMRYPLILLASLFIAVTMIFIYVIPNFEFVFKMLEGQMPFSTQSLLFIKDMLSEYFYIFFIVVLVLLVIGYKFYKKNTLYFDRVTILKIPVISPLIQSYSFYRLFLMISIIVKSKYQFQLAILNSKNIVSNRYIQACMNEVLKSIKNGSSIAQSFEATKLFDDLTIKLLYTAEQTNQYEVILHDIAMYYKKRFQDSLKNFSSFIEPAIILIISLIVLWLILAIMVPIWDLGSVIS